MPLFPRSCRYAAAGLIAALFWVSSQAATPQCTVEAVPPPTAEEQAQQTRRWGVWETFEQKHVRLDGAKAPIPTYNVITRRPGAQINTAKPVVVFLHGLPEFAHSWENYLKLIGEQHDAIAIDLQGFGDSTRPTDLKAYDLFRVTSELSQVISCLGYKKAIPVGHDWGGTFAWLYSIMYPSRTQAVVVMATPHPYTFYRELARVGSEQRQMSEYMGLIRENTPAGSAAGREILAGGSPDMLEPFYAGARTTRLFLTNLNTPAKWEAMFGYYRTMDYRPSRLIYHDKPGLLLRTLFKVRAPTLAFYGTADPFFSADSWRGVDTFVPKLDFRRLEGEGHFINHQVPGMPQAVLDFINVHAP